MILAADNRTGQQTLTVSERTVLARLLQRESNKEIAAVLGKAVATVKHQVSSILRKHSVPSRSRLIALLR